MPASKTTFPNYLETRKYVPGIVWHLGRALTVFLLAGLLWLLWFGDSQALDSFWHLAVPLLPLVFFITPGLWRNLCPLATVNQLPRQFGGLLTLELPDGLRRYAGVIGISLLLLIVPLRKIFLQDDPRATAIMIFVALMLALAGGLVFKGKSGWCGTFCPLSPLQRAYGQTPFLTVSNSHCKPCVACTKNCYDFNPQVAYIADLYDDERHLGNDRKFFIAALPGFLYAFFTLPDFPEIQALELYRQIGLYMLISLGLFYVIETYIKVSVHKITALFTVVCLNLFYWYVTPDMVDALWRLAESFSITLPAGGIALPVPVDQQLTWLLRATVLLLSMVWVVNTFRKEALFFMQVASASATRVPSSALRIRASMHFGGKPEITVMPLKKMVYADPDRSLLEALEEGNVAIESGCRMGVCGADPVAILDGADKLSPAGPEERATLERLGYAANTRMACSTRACGHVAISLKPEISRRPPVSTIKDFKIDKSIGRVVIIGNGAAGVTAADYIRRYYRDCDIQIIGNEKHPFYNRIGITRLIHGRSAMHGLYLLPEEWYQERNITTLLNTRVAGIDFADKAVKLAAGEPLHYDRLILAMGSDNHLPAIKGFGLPGTFALRKADDAMEIRAYAQEKLAKTAVVAGGGLLGLETAYALHALGLQVTVLERSAYLLPRQLDRRAAKYLQQFLENLGLRIIHGAEISSASGEEYLETIYLKGRQRLKTDILVVAAGIQPNIELVENSTLEIGHGIRVDSGMRTNLEGVYAAGDIAESRDGEIHGLWPVAVEQGRVAGINAVGGNQHYLEKPPAAMLKVSGIKVFSIGQSSKAGRKDKEIIFEDTPACKYRKLILRGETIVGAILLNCPEYVLSVTQVVQQRQVLSKSDLKALQRDDWSVLNRGL
jgi:NADPH-dependent 2,4-dienoyl-CoA reductase/sulfur reductase-like enzyme/ferredoxin